MYDLNQMIQEIVKKDLMEIAQKAANEIVQAQVRAAAGQNSIPVPRKANKNKGPNRYKVNAIVELNKSAKIEEKAGTVAFKVYQVASDLLQAGPAPRVELSKALMSEMNMTLGSVSRTLTTMLDKGYLKVVQ